MQLKRKNHTNGATHSARSEKEENLEEFANETDKCLNESTSSRKPRLIIMYGFITLFVFVTGFLIGFFTRSQVQGMSEKSNINHHISQENHDFKILLESFDKKKMRADLRYFSSKPHPAGSQRVQDLANEIKSRWKSYGLDVETVEYDVLLPKGKAGNPDYIEIRNSAGNATFKHPMVYTGKSEPRSNKIWSLPRFVFYSPSGAVQGGLLYANEGRRKDFDYLKKINISTCNGSIVLLKMAFGLRFGILEQIENAHKCQASAVLFFYDKDKNPRHKRSSVYPNGTQLPHESPLIFSLRNRWSIGDALTPGLPATDGIYRLNINNTDVQVKLPVQLVEYQVAKFLLQNLQGNRIPNEWKLKSKETNDFRVGPLLFDNSTFHLVVNSKAERTKIFDIIGTIHGREEPDHWVLVGNHRDAIVFGAADPGSGTAGLMELSRGLGELLKTGWKPRRTIKLCSWSAEETGIIGSTEYVEDNLKILQDRAVAYINIDMLVHGNGSLKASGNPLLAELIFTQTQKIQDPHGYGNTIYSTWRRKVPDPKNKSIPTYNIIPFGSDYIPFYEIAGVPSIDLQYGATPFSLPPSYHTAYDTYHYVTLIDPHFKLHLAQTQLTARLLYKLANSPLIPFNVNFFTASLQVILNRTRMFYDKILREHNISLSSVATAVIEFEQAGREYEEMKHQCAKEQDEVQIRRFNTRMIALNKMFISPEPLPNRFPVMRNLVHGKSQNMFYPNITLAGISDAILSAKVSGNWEQVKRQISLTYHAITLARKTLKVRKWTQKGANKTNLEQSP